MATENYQFINTPTQFITLSNGIKYAYRRMGKKSDVPIFFFNHLTSNMDNCDPSIMDKLAEKHEIFCFDYKGVGYTTGNDAQSIQEMAVDSLAFIKALGYNKIDIISFSMGGFIAQELIELDPTLVHKIVLAGTSPRGGKGISDVVGLTYWDIFKGYLTFKDPKYYLFFNSTQENKTAAIAFLNRLKERKKDRDIPVKIKTLIAQLKVIKNWGYEKPADLSSFKMPVLVVYGDNDRMVPTANSYDLADRIPNAILHIYKNSAHGAIFQFHEDFVKRTLAFLAS